MYILPSLYLYGGWGYPPTQGGRDGGPLWRPSSHPPRMVPPTCWRFSIAGLWLWFKTTYGWRVFSPHSLWWRDGSDLYSFCNVPCIPPSLYFLIVNHLLIIRTERKINKFDVTGTPCICIFLYWVILLVNLGIWMRPVVSHYTAARAEVILIRSLSILSIAEINLIWLFELEKWKLEYMQFVLLGWWGWKLYCKVPLLGWRRPMI